MRAKANQKSRLISESFNIVGFDPGSTSGFGYCVLRLRNGKVGIIKKGTWFFKRDGFEGAGMQMLKLGLEVEHLFDDISSDRIKTVCAYELNRGQKGKTAAAVNGAIIRRIMEVCELCKIPYTGLAPNEARKHAFGKGNTKKEEAKRILEDMFEVEFDTENASDAGTVALGFVNQMGWI